MSSTDNVLIAVVGVRGNRSDAPDSITFGGQSLTELSAIPYTENGGAALGYYYLTDSTVTTGDFIVDGNLTGDAYFAVYSLANADTNTSNWLAASDFSSSGSSPVSKCGPGCICFNN